jgi:tetratricopeptide (TPR) repeat protein
MLYATPTAVAQGHEEAFMTGFLVIPFVGALYTVLFGLLPAIRHEGVSARFLLESLAITAVASIPGILGAFAVHPAVFVILLYLVTMRVRLLVDLGSSLARRGRVEQARSAYALAARLWPDPAGALMVMVNQGACSLRQGQPEDAIAKLEMALQKAPGARLGVKYLAVCHYNLALAFWRTDRRSRAESEFEAVTEVWPLSPYAKRAEEMLARMKGERA